MKKIVILMIVLVLAFSLTACKKEEDKTNSKPSKNESQTSENESQTSEKEDSVGIKQEISGYEVETFYSTEDKKELEGEINKAAVDFLIALSENDMNGIKALVTEDFYNAIEKNDKKDNRVNQINAFKGVKLFNFNSVRVDSLTDDKASVFLDAEIQEETITFEFYFDFLITDEAVLISSFL